VTYFFFRSSILTYMYLGDSVNDESLSHLQLLACPQGQEPVRRGIATILADPGAQY